MHRTESERRRGEYERVVLRELRRVLLDPGGWRENLEIWGETHEGVRVQDIRLDTTGPEHEVVFLFRDLGRPECLFGYRVPALEDAGVLNARTSPYSHWKDAAQSYAEVLFFNLEEELYALGYGLPGKCSPDSVTWIGERPPAG
jgi:hypothetical protein